MSSIVKNLPCRSSGRVISIKQMEVKTGLTEEADTEKDNARNLSLENAGEILNRAREEAGKLIRDAEAKAAETEKQIEQTLETARRDAQLQYEESRKKGFTEGFEDGRKEGLASCDGLYAQARETVVQSKGDYRKKLTEAEPVLLELAAAVSKKIIGEALGQNGNWIRFVQTAVDEVRERQEISIYVHPGRYEQTLLHKHEFEQIAARTDEVFVYPDPSLPDDGCVLETESGKVDAGVDSQLSELKNQLHQLLEKGD
ncbi:flagellar assembly protein FliH [Alteribacter natronophilus]|uniref:flagellar assembly protein FliH n=1 Tax=Alteribacter natronophilus TaxID=2583810 RepID=UPI00110D5AED|nr:flagellar assembly protein FliH [Alteribacter natronophilus]TMW73213.1 flagellar assembly protein FliH [Alteribacter natronophilus]